MLRDMRAGAILAVSVGVGLIRLVADAAPPPAPAGRASLLPAVAESGEVAPDRSQAESLRALAARARVRTAAVPSATPPASQPAPVDAAPPAPLPGEEWNDPDSVNWSDAQADGGRGDTGAEQTRRRGLFGDRRREQPQAEPRRLLDRLRGEGRGPPQSPDANHVPVATPLVRWPAPVALQRQLDPIAKPPRLLSGGDAEAGAWARRALDTLADVLATGGPTAATADQSLVTLGEVVEAGMALGDAIADPTAGTSIRRASIAIARRVAVWRAAIAACIESDTLGGGGAPADLDAKLATARAAAEVTRLLDALERIEQEEQPDDAAMVRKTLRSLEATGMPRAAEFAKAVGVHYLAPNVRVAVHREFVEKVLPESTVNSGPMEDYVLGRKVRGTRTVEQSTGVRFVPDPDELRFELLVNGEIASRTVTEAGPVAIHSRAAAVFTVRKPVTVSPRGLVFGPALGTASTQSQLATIQTSFDAVPLMGPLVRSFARSQHDEAQPEATREVNTKIVTRACREVDRQSEPTFSAMAERIRDRIWTPLVSLGLEPAAVALETTPTLATARLRLAAGTQLAAHTPRPRSDASAMLSVQVHESSVNNGFDQFGLGGRRLGLEDLIRQVCTRIGIEPRIPDDLPEGVEVTFAASQPLRISCRDGLLHVRVALDALESGRRDWYDVVAQVAYKPVMAGAQVFLEREGPVQIGGTGHQGRLEIPLRLIFSKIFAKERPVALLPSKVLENPRTADLRAVQAACADGWFAMALASGDQTAGPPAAKPRAAAAPPQRRR